MITFRPLYLIVDTEWPSRQSPLAGRSPMELNPTPSLISREHESLSFSSSILDSPDGFASSAVGARRRSAQQARVGGALPPPLSFLLSPPPFPPYCSCWTLPGVIFISVYFL
ncbi:hypothetical protein FRC03_011280 [Tulasnella sp. 419]|nr:hypothetical protein FRC02_010995 [Tulasnella sp. 418]KAG8955222.1 hypothetical protein FRC03_011280 [Tulasnella sp. 419]